MLFKADFTAEMQHKVSFFIFRIVQHYLDGLTGVKEEDFYGKG
jgi:hypothetical protein